MKTLFALVLGIVAVWIVAGIVIGFVSHILHFAITAGVIALLCYLVFVVLRGLSRQRN